MSQLGVRMPLISSGCGQGCCYTPCCARDPPSPLPAPAPVKDCLNLNVHRAAVMEPTYAEVLKVMSLTRLVGSQIQGPTPLLQPEQDKGTMFGKGKVRLPS